MIAREAEVSSAGIRLETVHCVVQSLKSLISFIFFVIFRKAETMHFGTELQVSESVKF